MHPASCSGQIWGYHSWPLSFSNTVHPIYLEILLALLWNISRIFFPPSLPSHHHYYNRFPADLLSSTSKFIHIEASDPFKPQISSCLLTSVSLYVKDKAITGFPGLTGAAPTLFLHFCLATRAFLLFLKHAPHVPAPEPLHLPLFQSKTVST